MTEETAPKKKKKQYNGLLCVACSEKQYVKGGVVTCKNLHVGYAGVPVAADADAEATPEQVEAGALLHDRDVTSHMLDAVSVHANALDEDFVRVPADVAYYGEMHADAILEALNAKTDRERVYAQLIIDPNLSHELEEELGKKPTADQVKHSVHANERYLEAKRAENMAVAKQHRMRNRVEAIKSKRDMIISLGANQRLELMNDPIIKQRVGELRGSSDFALPSDDDERDLEDDESLL